MKFNAVCTDIDGTLLDARRELSIRTIAAFQKLPKEVLVILASSRMPSAMRHLQNQLNVAGHPLICYNGGYVVHYENDSTEPTVFDSVTMPLDVCTGIVKLTAGTTIHTSLYFRDEWYAPQWDQWTERESTITKVKPIVLSNAEVFEKWSEEGNGAHKVMCMGSEQEINDVEQKLNDLYGDDIHVYRSRLTYLELAPKLVSKGSALALLLKKKYSFGLKEVIAFGDNYNDIELLREAGHGVAVSNARAEVKEVANEVTGDSKQDGVAESLEKYFSLSIRQ